MKYIIVAPVGDNINNLFIGIKEFPVKKIILIAPKERVKEAEDAQKQLRKFKIESTIIKSRSNSIEEMFRIFKEIKINEPHTELIVNVATGDAISSCAALSASFVNGMKAFGVQNDEVMMLPVLKFSYYRLIPDKKMKILEYLYHRKDCCSSMEDLSKRLKMSLPLLSYHINGNLKSEGLKQLGLIDAIGIGGRITIKLTTLANLILKGYVK